MVYGIINKKASDPFGSHHRGYLSYQQDFISQMLHGPGISTYIYPKNGPVM